MSFRGRGAGLVRATAVHLQRNPNRVVIPPLPGSPAAAPPAPQQRRASEYHTHKHIPGHTAQFLDRDGADALRRHEQLTQLHNATAAEVEKVWRDSKPHLRKQQALVEELGVEGAVRETLDPSRTSFQQELKSRPLDRAILEEIYLGLHGKRVERRLKKGVSWEHWITKGDGTAPVYTTSRKAQQTFAFGGNIKRVATATHPSQFPTVPLPGREALARARGSDAGTGRGRRSHRGKPTTALPQRLVDRDLLVPEVAFIGRTSSGKSSLINAIVNASIAPYGHLQGTTSALHFYSVAGKVMLVDCPGFGYYNPLETPQLDAENAVKAMRAYLKSGARRRRLAQQQQQPPPPDEEEKQDDAHDGKEGGNDGSSSSSSSSRAGKSPAGSSDVHDRAQQQQPRNIKRVFLCVPSRGMQHMDMAYCRLLEDLGIPFSVVLTKTDAAPIRMLARLTDYTRAQLVPFNQCKELMLASSLRLAGIDKMQALIGSMAVTEDRMDGATMDFSAIV